MSTAVVLTAAKSLEDPRKMLDQAVSEMREDLVKMRQASAEVMSTQKMLESKYSQAQASAVSSLSLASMHASSSQGSSSSALLDHRHSWGQRKCAVLHVMYCINPCKFRHTSNMLHALNTAASCVLEH